MTPRAATVDEGWSLPAEPAGSLIRSVPSTTKQPVEAADSEVNEFQASVVGATELDAGWILAEGTFEREVTTIATAPGVMPLSFRPAPLASEQVLSIEAQEEFSKPDLALGTDIDLPPPGGLWFGELAPVVARQAPRPARRTRQPVNIRSCFSASEDSFFAEGDQLDQASEAAVNGADDDEAPDETGPSKRRWWQWRR